MKIILLFVLFFMPQIHAQGTISEEYQYDLYRGRVIEVNEKTVVEDEQKTVIQEAKVKILNRDFKDQTVTITNTLTGDPIYDMPLHDGSYVTIHYEENNFYFIGYDNTRPLIILLSIFLLSLIVIGGIKGVKALLALTITVSLIIGIMIPLLLRGINPILASIFVCALATVITFSIIAGINKKSLSATIGTTGGLILGGLIAYSFSHFARLSGFSTNDASMLLYLPNAPLFDFRGLLFAGIIIGALGAAMDVAISIASALTELQKENPNITKANLIKAGFNIGRDVMGTMINTLVLAYIGGTITMMLLFVGFQTSFYHLINLDFVATEVVRAVTGSIGLLFAIPLTIFAFVTISWRKHEKTN